MKKIPRFERQNRALKKRVRGRWRRPRGIDNKMRLRRRGFGAMPSVGYRQRRTVRGLHPRGVREVLVSNFLELERVGKECMVRIASGVGERKRKSLLEKAKQMGLRVLN